MIKRYCNICGRETKDKIVLDCRCRKLMGMDSFQIDLCKDCSVEVIGKDLLEEHEAKQRELERKREQRRAEDKKKATEKKKAESEYELCDYDEVSK